MTPGYKLVQLAPGAYDVEFEGTVVASLVKDINAQRWTAELLDPNGRMPSPFKRSEHVFRKLSDALFWLGDPDVISTPSLKRPGSSGLLRPLDGA
jgi:hypothetical protein